MEPVDMFASEEQMAARSQGAIPVDHPFLRDALRAATAEVRKYCGWHIADEARETVFLDDADGPIVALPSGRVRTVHSIKVNGEAADLSSLLWLRDGRLAKAYYVPTYRVAEVELTHGFETVPADLVDLTLQVAARALGSPLGVVREQAGGVSVTYSQAGFNVAGGTVLLEHEKAQLAPYKLGWAP